MARKKHSRREEPTRPISSFEIGPSVARREWLALAVIFVVGASLRFAYPSAMAIEHFDEGVYSTNIYFGDAEDGQYPYRHLYAPPLLPFLIEMGMIAFGPHSLAPFLPALILGTATVPLAWWTVRNWFGPLAGLLAALLIATSDFHILYSRTALTDVPVAFFILLAVYLFWEAIRRESIRWSVAAGIATGLAWWTKYTGWLPLAIAAAGSIGWLIVERRTLGNDLRTQIKTVVKCFATMALAAFLVWFPVLLSLQRFGGYSSVAENHRSYLRGGWLNNAYEQIGNVAAQSGIVTVIGAAILTGTVIWRSRREALTSSVLALFAGALLVALVFIKGPLLPFMILAVGGLILDRFAAALVRTHSTNAPSERNARTAAVPEWRLLAIWLLGAWMTGMAATVPTYQHFPRLALMGLLPVLLSATSWAERSPFPTLKAIQMPSRATTFAACSTLALIAALIVGQYQRSAPHSTSRWSIPAWQSRVGVEKAASKVAAALKADSDDTTSATILYVHAEPAAFYHLSLMLSSDRIGVMPAGNLALVSDPPPGIEVYMVYGWRSEEELQNRQDYNWFSSRATYVAKVGYVPSTLVRLDGESRLSVTAPPESGDYELRFYRVGKPSP